MAGLSVVAARGARVIQWCVVALMLAAVLFGAGRGSAEAQTPDPPPAEGYASGEVLVKFEPGTSGASASGVHAQNGGQVQDVIPGIDVQVVSVDPGREQAAVTAYEQDPEVVFAEVNGVYQAADHGKPNDPQVDQQWQYHNTGETGGTAGADIYAFEAWHTTTGSATVPIAVLDTGIDQSHEDLQGKVARNANFTASATASDLYGHGTHVAGSAAATTGNGIGVAGTCRDCVIYNAKVLGDEGSGNWDGIANGIRWAADNGARVINMSLAGPSPSLTVEEAVDYAWERGVVVVAAAGNYGVSEPYYPAYYANVIAVGATDYTDTKWSGSNYGAWVDVAAPGVGILSTAIDDPVTTEVEKYAKNSGTSMATPHVAGVAGLVRSAFPNAGNQAVRDKIETTADRIAGTGTYWSDGRLNACKAVGGTCDRAGGPPTDVTPPSVAQPDERLLAFSQLGASSVPVKIKWSGSDDESGVERYELQRSVNGGAYSPVVLPAPAATKVTPPLEPGHDYRFRVRARDEAGNWSTWAVGRGFRLSADQENSASVSYPSGSWSKVLVTEAYGGAFKSSSVSPDKARFTFTGQEIAWVSSKGSNRGKAEVYVDGVKRATVDLYASSNRWRQVVFVAQLSPGTHTLEVRPTGTKNPSSSNTRVDVDAFVSID